MDANAFDRLTRIVGIATSRRTALTGLTGGLTALVTRLAPDSAPDAAAKPNVCRPLGRACVPNRGLTCCRGATCQNGRCQCPKQRRRCGQRCLPKNRCCRHRDCPANQRCRQGRCQCPPGKKRCGKRCIPRNACCRNGDCGRFEACVRGSCRCASHAKRCGDACIPSDQCCQDADCGVNGACVEGVCDCAAGFKDCAGTCILVDGCCDATDCTADQNCEDHICVAKRCGTGGACRVFTTAQTHNPNLGGVEGADAICQAAANGSTRTQGGTYKAWIADSTESSAPVNRFTNLENTGPYTLVDNAGTLLANDWADLTTLKGPLFLRAQISVSEAGNSLGAGEAWTNVDPSGERLTDTTHCDGWTSDEAGVFGRVGNILGTSSTWTNYGASRACASNELRLYCFEQG